MGRWKNLSLLPSRCIFCFSSFYTGKQKIIDSGGRVDRFKKRFAKKKAASPKVEEVELKSESTNEDNLKEDSESSNAENS